MEHKTKRTLYLLNGAFLIILLSPFMKNVGAWLYYGLLIIGLIMAVAAGSIFFKEYQHDKKNKQAD